jgi:hypothetical protein
MHRIIKRAAVGAAIAMTATAGIAVASIPGPNGVINGCVKKTSGAVTVIDSAAKCPTGTTPLNWNQTGPQGAPGAPGIDGTDGVSGYEVVEKTAVMSPGVVMTTATAECPAGKRPLGGGEEIHNILAANSAAKVVESRPTATGWTSTLFVDGQVGRDTNWRVWVTCAIT